MKKVLLGICLSLPLSALAQGFSYDYVEGVYAQSESDDNNASIDFDTGALGFGWAPTQDMYTKFGASYSDVDDSPMDQRSLSAAVGGRLALQDNIDLYLGGLVAYQRISDVGFDSDLDGTGLGAEIGLRAWLFPGVELEANGTFLDYYWGDIDDLSGDTNDFTAGLGARFYPTPRLSIGAGYAYAFDAETETLSAGVRYDY